MSEEGLEEMPWSGRPALNYGLEPDASGAKNRRRGCTQPNFCRRPDGPSWCWLSCPFIRWHFLGWVFWGGILQLTGQMRGPMYTRLKYYYSHTEAHPQTLFHPFSVPPSCVTLMTKAGSSIEPTTANQLPDQQKQECSRCQSEQQVQCLTVSKVWQD